MYNAHRGMVPASNNRLTELLDQVRAEFDNQQSRTAEYDQQSKSAPYWFVADIDSVACFNFLNWVITLWFRISTLDIHVGHVIILF